MSIIKILSIKFLPGDRPLRAFVDLEYNRWTYRGFRVVQQNGQRAFVASPQVSWKDPDTGQIRYESVIDIPPEERQVIHTEILHSYRMELEKRNGHQSE